MAILAAAGGAALGNAIGIGSSAGWLIGSVIGNLLFPSGQDTTTEGPRLQDLSVTSSAYGASRCIGFGTIRQSGNMIWSSGIREKKTTRSVHAGKGGGGATQTQITYTYFCSFAIAFGEGEAERVLRIWADGNLIFDKTGDTINTRMSGLTFRFYPGDDEQLPDSLIQSHKGEENTPAFRGTVYIVFDNLPLANFGNRIPSISAEIAYVSIDAGVDAKSTNYSGGVTSYSYDSLAVDWERQLAYVQTSSANTLRRVNLITMLEDRQVSGTDAFDQSAGSVEFQDFPMIVMPDGGLVMAADQGGGTSNTEPIIRLDPNTLVETDRFGYSSTLGNWPLTAPLADFLAPIQMYTLVGDLMFLWTAGVLGTSCGIIEYPDFRYTWDSDNMVYTWDGRIRACCGGKKGDGYGTCFFITCADTAPTSIVVHRITVEAIAVTDLIRGTSNAALAEVVETYAVGDLAPGESSFVTCDGLIYNEIDETLMFAFQRTSDTVWQYVKIDASDGSIIWITDDMVQGPNDGSHWGMSRLEDSTFGFLRGQFGVQIDTQTGDLIVNGTPPWTIQHGGYGGLYDSRSESFIDTVSTGEISLIGRWFFGRGSGEGETLGGIVQEICERVGLEESDLDVTDISSVTVPGYAIGRQVSARSAIETLTQLYLFDGVESDFILKFVLRGQDPVRTITQDELAYLNEEDNEFVTESRTQEVELPETFTIVYMDKDEDYVQNAHSAKRVVQPERSMYSNNTANLSVAVAIASDTAKQQAEKILYSAWIERTTYATRFSWEHLDLDPTDVVNIALDNGVTYRSRIAQSDVGAGLTIDVSALSEDEAQFESSVIADSGQGVREQTVRSETALKTVIMDCPLLRDTDEPVGRAYAPIYYFMAGYASSQFSMGTLYKSSDGVAYEYEGIITSDMSWGATANALGDPPFDNPFATDTENTLTVFMQVGEDDLSSVTNLQMLNGANAAAIIKNNGEIEIIQFQNVTENANGSFTLDTLLRGRRGTDTMSFDHTNGELFVLLIATDGGISASILAEMDVPRYYRGLSPGQYIEEVQRITLTSEHRALMPYAPVQVAAVVDGSDIDISWLRRTRIGGGLQDYEGDVPLAEDDEEYDVEIYDGPGGSLLRTASGLTSNEYTYASADITTDFGSIPSQLTLKVYQVSAQVGRGFAYEVTVDVE